MSRTSNARFITAATVLAVGMGVMSAAPAMAGDDDVIRHGSCSGRADWKLKAKADDGRLEVEGEVDSNVNGQHWRWRILHDGNVSARGRARTMGPSGSFDIERRVVNAPGTDRIGWRAVNRATGQTCSGGLRF
jgi:hypothetical protein